jgi:hypothetical protein
LPAAAPIAAPAAAPRSVPTTALPAVLWLAASLAEPDCCSAHWRHAPSSPWNCSKVFPVPGNAIMLGPDGTVAHAVSSSPETATSAAEARIYSCLGGTLTQGSAQDCTEG